MHDVIELALINDTFITASSGYHGYSGYHGNFADGLPASADYSVFNFNLNDSQTPAEMQIDDAASFDG